MPETFTVPVICAWCKKDMQTGRQLSNQEYEKTRTPEAKESHGICPACSAKHFPTPLPGEHKSFSLNNEMAYSGFPGSGVSDWSYGEQGEQYIQRTKEG